MYPLTAKMGFPGFFWRKKPSGEVSPFIFNKLVHARKSKKKGALETERTCVWLEGWPWTEPSIAVTPSFLLWKWRLYYSPFRIARKMNWDNVGQNAQLRALRKLYYHYTFILKKKKKAAHWENMISLNKENQKTGTTYPFTIFKSDALWSNFSVSSENMCCQNFPYISCKLFHESLLFG